MTRKFISRRMLMSLRLCAVRESYCRCFGINDRAFCMAVRPKHLLKKHYLPTIMRVGFASVGLGFVPKCLDVP